MQRLPRLLQELHTWLLHPKWNTAGGYTAGHAPICPPLCEFIDWATRGKAHD